MLTRRKFLAGLAGGALAGIGGAAYGWRVEPRWLEVTETRIPLPAGLEMDSPLRILHLADLHFGRYVPFSFIAEAIRRGLALRPDVICVTGDFYTVGHRCDDAVYAATLAPLAAAAPTFGTLGNHDGGVFGGPYRGEGTGAMLAHAGIRWLDNEITTLTVRGQRLHLVGLGDLWHGQCLPEIAFRGFVPGSRELTVALSHNPDSKNMLLAHPWQVLLCGHTHGGQIGVPGLAQRFAPVRDKRFLGGLYPYAGRQLYITRGVGNLHGVRIFCRPQVSLLTFA